MQDGPGVSIIRVGGRSSPIDSFMTVPRYDFCIGLCRRLWLDSAAQGDEKWGQLACLVSLNRTPAVNLQNGSGRSRSVRQSSPLGQANDRRNALTLRP